VVSKRDGQGERHVNVAGGDDVHPRLGEDQGRGVAALHVAGHRRPDHLDQGVVAGQDPQRAHRRLAQGGGGLAGLVQVDHPLGPVGPGLPAARCDHAAHHDRGTQELVVVGRMAGCGLERAPGMEQAIGQAPVGNVVIADDDEARIGQAANPVAGLGEFARQALLGDVARDQDQVRRMGVREIDGRLAGVTVLAPEMHVGELEDAPH
jgi:hypothetical protein